MIIKPITDFDGYFVSNTGKVFSNKKGTLKELSTWHGKNNNYNMVGLVKNHKRYRLLVHRLVAKEFIPNKDNLPVINHKDANVNNNSVENLEWTTTRDNMLDCFSRCSQVRNFKNCKLYKNNEYIASFKSIKEAIRFAKKEFDISPTMLEKHRKHKDIFLKV